MTDPSSLLALYDASGRAVAAGGALRELLRAIRFARWCLEVGEFGSAYLALEQATIEIVEWSGQQVRRGHVH